MPPEVPYEEKEALHLLCRPQWTGALCSARGKSGSDTPLLTTRASFFKIFKAGVYLRLKKSKAINR